MDGALALRIGFELSLGSQTASVNTRRYNALRPFITNGLLTQ